MAPQNQFTTDAIFITKTGTWFLGKASHPHQNFLTLVWEYSNKKVKSEFVYFGHVRNRVLYHEIEIEIETTALA